MRALVLPFLFFLLSACASRPERGGVPRFRGRLDAPLAIRVIDQRAAVPERNPEKPEWMYLRDTEPDGAMQLAMMVGNALNGFRATPGYRVLVPDAPDDAAPYLLSLTLVQGYARWPLQVGRDIERVPVEGRYQIRWALYKEGRRVASGRQDSAPKPFEVPLNLIREDNVDKIVRDSLFYQYGRSMNGALDGLLHALARRWERYVGE